MSLLVNTKVIDSITRRPMSAVNVYISDSSGNPVEHNGVPNVGRITGKDGTVIIPVAVDDDFVTFSYVGYQKLTIPGETAAGKKLIIMRTISQDLPETTIETPRSNPKNVVFASAPKTSKKTWIIIGAALAALAIGVLIYFIVKRK